MDGTIGDVRLLLKEVVTLRIYSGKQTIGFDGSPDSGKWTLLYNLEETAELDYAATANEVETALNDLASLSEVEVTGSMGSGFTVLFLGADGDKDHPLLKSGTNTLKEGVISVDIEIEMLSRGYDSEGNYQVQYYSDTDIYGNVQPVTGEELQQIPNYDAKRNTLKIFTKTELKNTYRIVKSAIEYELNNIEVWYGYYKGLMMEVQP